MFQDLLLAMINCAVLLTVVSLAQSASIPLAHRAMVFEFHMTGHKLTNSRLAVYRNIETFSCFKLCMIHPQCISINWNRNGFCQLNSQDNYSFKSALQIDPNFNFSGMGKNEVAECNQQGTSKSIQDDGEFLNLCRINGKRVDSQWINEEPFEELQRPNYWQRHLPPKCFEGFHGGKTCSGSGDVMVVEWIRHGCKFQSQECLRSV